MDAGTLTEILSGKHLSMPDRIDRGAWPHPPLLFADVVQHLASVVASRDWFPKPFRTAAPGDLVADLTAVERRGPHEYVVHVQRSGPSGYTIAGAAERRFDSPTDAAAFFLRAEYRLPGDIDGWKIVE
jgi:hypothetical protein